MRRKLLRRRVLIPAVAALTLTGAAVAAWIVTSTGGPGRGQLGTIVAPTVTTVSPSSGDCLPGASCAISVSINNPNTSPVKLTDVNFGGNVTVEKPLGTTLGTCPNTNITWPSSLSGLTITVAPGTATYSIPGAYTLSASAPVACMGAYISRDQTAIFTFATP